MNQKFSLLKTLGEEEQADEKTPLPKGINYQEYIIDVQGQELSVFIPLREYVAFEQSLSDIESLDRDALRDILRKHRGIKG